MQLHACWSGCVGAFPPWNLDIFFVSAVDHSLPCLDSRCIPRMNQRICVFQHGEGSFSGTSFQHVDVDVDNQ
jgi:hypothetical protein